MKYVKLKELVELKQGLAINSKTNHLVSDNKTSIHLLRIADMSNNTKTVFMDEKTPDKYWANENDIIYTRTGQVGLVFRGQQGIVHNNCFRVIPLDNKKIDKDYLYWTLKLKSVYELANRYAAGSAQPDLPHDSFKRIKIPYFEIGKQKKIAGFLDKYEKLINNNNTRIKVLEHMAENLYKEWFVRFRFPGYENIDIVNGLPKGWERKKISFVYDTSSGGTPSRQHEEYYSNGVIPWIKTGELQDCILVDTEEYITDDAVKHSSAKLIPANSVLMAMYGVNIGKLGYTSIEATCNQACCVFKDKYYENSRHYLFQYLKSIREYLLLIGFGAAQQNLSQDLIKGVKIVVPPKEVLLKFENLIEPLYNESKLLLKKNKNMIKQRDLLLPRLMSGKLEVK